MQWRADHSEVLRNKAEVKSKNWRPRPIAYSIGLQDDMRLGRLDIERG